MKAVQFAAQLTKIETRTDGSIKITAETQELNGSDMAELFSYRSALGYITFTPNAESKVDAPSLRVKLDGKSKAERLRNVLYVKWEQSGKQEYDVFDLYYDVQMERMINQIKDTLED